MAMPRPSWTLYLGVARSKGKGTRLLPAAHCALAAREPRAEHLSPRRDSGATNCTPGAPLPWSELVSTPSACRRGRTLRLESQRVEPHADAIQHDAAQDRRRGSQRRFPLRREELAREASRSGRDLLSHGRKVAA